MPDVLTVFLNEDEKDDDKEFSLFVWVWERLTIAFTGSYFKIANL